MRFGFLIFWNGIVIINYEEGFTCCGKALGEDKLVPRAYEKSSTGHARECPERRHLPLNQRCPTALLKPQPRIRLRHQERPEREGDNIQ